MFVPSPAYTPVSQSCDMTDDNRQSSQSAQDSITIADSPRPLSLFDIQSALYPVNPDQEAGEPSPKHISYPSDGRYSRAATVSPEVGADSPQAAWAEYDADSAKEAVPPPEKEAVSFTGYKQDDTILPKWADGGESEPNQARPIGFLRRFRWFFIGLLIGVILALAVGLGVGFGINKKDTPTNSNATATPSPSPSNFSQGGVFNMSGFAIGSQNRVSEPDGQVNLFYQHYTGELRWLIKANDDWSGSPQYVVATDAKNATPISTVILPLNGSYAKWHVFYIDKNNYIRERIRETSNDDKWTDGPLNDLQLIALDFPHISFASMYCAWLGSGKDEGIQLFYASDNYTIQEVDWVASTGNWNKTGSISANGHIGIGSYTWDSTHSLIYLMVGNHNNELNILWKDMNSSVTATPTHPVKTWTNSSVVIPGLYSSSSVAWNNILMQQMSNGSVIGSNVTLDAENTRLIPGSSFELPTKPLLGSQIWIWEFNAAIKPQELTVIDQINGSDLTATTMIFGSQSGIGNLSGTAIDIPEK
ncbi:hypothetical protein BT63DRAFT_423401 [Microthyrium microscopicum]|uniref:Fucose-specific lectin n=1 Tax=Microthyrium microscopicum TaxID=703497 RepID=A0A6A6UI99_9PEZI|nr:hypothetical protein BT63DRAFT_423401 [Microthyrium microscopicum]